MSATGAAAQVQVRAARRTGIRRLIVLIVAWAVVVFAFVTNDLAFFMAGVLVLFIGTRDDSIPGEQPGSARPNLALDRHVRTSLAAPSSSHLYWTKDMSCFAPPGWPI